MIVKLDELVPTLAKLEKEDILAIDLETTGLMVQAGHKLFGIAIATELDTYYFNYNDLDKSTQLPWATRILFEDLLANPDRLWVNHNIKFDMHFLEAAGIPILGQVWCTQVMARVQDNSHLQYGLAECAQRIGLSKSEAVDEYIDKHELYEMISIPGKKTRVKNKFFYKVPLDIVAPYAERDARLAFALYRTQRGMMQEDPTSSIPCQGPLIRLEKRTTKTLARMEKTGVLVDRAYCEQGARTECEHMERAALAFTARSGKELVDSAKGLAPVFAQYGIQPGRTEKGNPSFTAEVLAKIDHPIVKHLTDYRDAKKRLSTYFSSFLYFSQWDGRIHANHHQAGATTGRLSVSGPNLQNLTEDEESAPLPIRAAFVADEGGDLVSLDYTAMEYYFLLDQICHLEKRVIPWAAKVLEGMDVHEASVALVKEKAGLTITRPQAKTTNFLTLYGGGPELLSQRLKCTFNQARQIRQAIFDGVPELPRTLLALQHRAYSRGFIYNWVGRRYHFPDKNLCYKAANHWDQGGCSDIMRYALTSIDDLLLARGAQTKLLLTIHDEIVAWVPPSERELIGEMRRRMVEAYPAKYLPMAASVHLGKNLHAMEEWHGSET